VFDFNFVGSKRANVTTSERNPHDPVWQATDDAPWYAGRFNSARHFGNP
jgi:hypothetical protein